jgi:hypothetical protein
LLRHDGSMNPVVDLQFRALRAFRLAVLAVLTMLLVVMVYASVRAAGAPAPKPASASPASDKSHYDPFIPVQWLHVLDTRT